MIKDTIIILYSFITKLVLLLEDEINELSVKKPKSEVSVKKNITETLNKLVYLIIQLNKLYKEEILNNKIIMSEEDKDIITTFLNKYSKNQ